MAVAETLKSRSAIMHHLSWELGSFPCPAKTGVRSCRLLPRARGNRGTPLVRSFAQQRWNANERQLVGSDGFGGGIAQLAGDSWPDIADAATVAAAKLNLWLSLLFEKGGGRRSRFH